MATEHSQSWSILAAPAQTNANSWCWRLGRVLGIPIHIHVTASIVVVLVALSVSGLLRQWHPDWSNLVIVISACSAAVLFFVSLLLHELAHSLIALARGIQVRRITLFLFGGVAEIEGEPEHPQDEFLIALAGPLASMVLAGGFLLAASLTASTTPLPMDATAYDLGSLSAPVTVLLWLSVINFVLAAFNLLPGFPLDGGRVFRAAIWWVTNDYQRATNIAANTGAGIGWLIICGGLLYIFNGYLGNGVWCLMIGWFVRQLALASVQSARLQHTLKNTTAAQLMRTHFEVIDRNMPYAEFLDDYVMRSKQWVWPVSDNPQANIDGPCFVKVSDADLLTKAQSHNDTVYDHLTSIDHDNSLTSTTPALQALQKLTAQRGPMPVVEGNHVIGLLDHADVSRWLLRHSVQEA